ncbi:uncharacterized protein LOC110863019 [Folsomia candida]|uniref:uncharacterized protein LOC110863019 n=1 Tax=Folsomia candida TaxID=158441 RepID=UPI000B8FD723|nr:uncharacterized protein LOC110863019 [Folsomia candida]XP_035712718.1 uncharacterized protein LOC110863019 [Folsomia candida]
MDSGVLQVSAVLFLIFLVIVPNGCTPGTISCFVCSSRNGSYQACEDPFNAGVSTYVDRCKVPRRGHIGEFPAHFCIKIIGVSYSTNEKIVIRRCTSETMDKQCGQFRFEDDLLRGCILTCDMDGCNSSNLRQNSQPLLFFTCFVAMYLFLSFGASSIPASTSYPQIRSSLSPSQLLIRRESGSGAMSPTNTMQQLSGVYSKKMRCDHHGC